MGHKNGVKRVDCNPSGNKLVRIKYRSSIDGETKVRKASEEAFVISEKQCELLISNAKYKPNFDIPMDWDRQHEDKLAEKGILKYSDFFTIRNYAVNCGIFSDIMEQKNCGNSKYNEYLYFIFSSSLRYSNKMSRVTENWENGNPTSMDKHAFWLPNQYVEVNVVDIIKQRSKTILKGCAYSKSKLSKAVKEVDSFSDLKHGGEYLVLNRSSDSLPIPDEAIDMIITDPPYGSNVQYAELSTIWNVWYQAYAGLDNYIYKEREAVANRKKNFNGAKSIDDYEELLFRVYSEGNRVLKKDGYLVFTFNNKNIKVWIAMLKAVARAGFYLPEDGVLFQDYIDSYKNTAHLRFSGNIQGDFIYSFKKGEYRNEKKNNDNSIAEIIDNTIDVLIEKLYSEQKSYSTAELYRYIFASMTNRIMQYIKDKIVDGDEIEDISMFSNDYFDKELKKRLDYEGDVWLKKI